MEISTEAERKRTFVESKEPSYLAQPDAPRLTASFADPAEIDLVFASPAEARAAEVERQNRAATQKGDELDRERLAQIAETSTRIDITGMGKQKKERLAAQKKARADSSARYQQLLALQAALDGEIAAFDLHIAELKEEIRGIEAVIFTAEELAKFDALSAEERFAAMDAAMREKVGNGKMSEADYQKWLALNEEATEAQAKRDALADLRNQLADNPDEAFKATADGSAFESALLEEAAQKIDAQRTAEGKSPIDRQNVTGEDLNDLKQGLEEVAILAHLKQVKNNEQAKDISGAAASKDVNDSHEAIHERKEYVFESTDEAVERLMKEYARIEQITNPAERLEAERAYVEKIRDMAEDENLSDAAMEIEFADNTAHLFEDGYFASPAEQPQQAEPAEVAQDNDVTKNSPITPQQ